MVLTNGNTEVEVSAGCFVYAEEEDATKTNAVYTMWDDLEEDLKKELEELSLEISEKANKLKLLILSCDTTN